MTAIAAILGGAETGLAEFAEARLLARQAKRELALFLVNDRIATFAGPAEHAVSLHPARERLGAWLTRRAFSGFAMPAFVWSHRGADPEGAPYPYVNRIAEEWIGAFGWGGSSGLFAVAIAQLLGFERIVLCGVPMDPKVKNFATGKLWNEATAFHQAWIDHAPRITPCVRSFSGFTRDLLGVPDLEFVAAEMAHADYRSAV